METRELSPLTTKVLTALRGLARRKGSVDPGGRVVLDTNPTDFLVNYEQWTDEFECLLKDHPAVDFNRSANSPDAAGLITFTLHGFAVLIAENN